MEVLSGKPPFHSSKCKTEAVHQFRELLSAKVSGGRPYRKLTRIYFIFQASCSSIMELNTKQKPLEQLLTTLNDYLELWSLHEESFRCSCRYSATKGKT